MITYRFDNEEDRSATVNALRIAAERFDEHVRDLATIPGHERMAEQFKYQAAQVRRIADEIECIG